MKEKRSLFEMIFGRQREMKNETSLTLMNSYSPKFTDFSNNLYDSDIVRSAIDAIARNGAKLKPKHLIRSENGIEYPESNLNRILSVRPNRLMDAFTFYYKIITQLYLTNNAYVYIKWIPDINEIEGLYPISSNSIEFEEKNGEILVHFEFVYGQNISIDYKEIIHLRRFYNEHDIYGESSTKALYPLLNLIHSTDEGIINAIKTSASLRGILKFVQMLKPEDMRKQRDLFVKDYLDIANNGGVAATDAKMDYIPLDSDPKMIDSKQMAILKTKVYDYFGINENIVHSNYTEDEWNAFYESIIEPLSIQMSLEFSEKLITDTNKKNGHEIIFESNRLEHASMQSKLNLMQMVDRGAMTPNEWRKAMNLAPIEGGDEVIRRLDTRPITEDGG